MKKTFGLLCILIACACVTALLGPVRPAAGDPGGNGDCVGDLNDDGVVNVLDLLILLDDFGCVGECVGDINGDGVVNVLDLVLLISNFGPCGDPECETNADCDDGDPCTINFCALGQCVTVPSPLPQCN